MTITATTGLISDLVWTLPVGITSYDKLALTAGRLRPQSRRATPRFIAGKTSVVKVSIVEGGQRERET